MATKLVVDCSTGITTEVELTAEEARVAAEAAKLSAKASAESKLKALGLTDAEVSALLG